MKFSYKAIDKEGKIIEGEAEAKDKFDLAHVLKAQGESVMYAEEVVTLVASFISRLESIVERVSLRDKIIFMRNLAAMLEAGLPLIRALGVLIKQTSNKTFKKILEDTIQNINRGNSLSVALAEYTYVLPKLATSMIKAGEESGKLPGSLNVIGEHMEQSYLLRRRIKGAMMYPSVILIAMIIIGIFMMLYIVPTLTSVFEQLDVELPITTRIVISISQFLQEYTLTSLLIVFGAGFLFYFALKSPQGKRSAELVFLRIPVIGPLIKQVNSARTARTLSSLLSSGVSMVESISITKDVVQNSFYKDILEDAKTRVQKGTALSQVLSEHDDLYPILMGEIVAVGEETGKLSEMLMRVAVFYEGEVEQKTKNMSTIVEPILMIVVGIGVGFFAVSMITPLYTVLQGI